jgi:hypothetical protein
MINLLKIKYRPRNQALTQLMFLLLAGFVPILIAIHFMNLSQWDLSIPLDYREKNSDETWQYILTKMVVDTGWILTNPFLGAPDIAHWHNNPAAQTSALHSILMFGISKFVRDSITVQQLYFLLNFSLISLTSFYSCRLLGLARIASLCIGIMFSLLSFRFNHIAYSFIPNYFTAPLALVVIFWIMTGEYFKFFTDTSKNNRTALREALLSPRYLLGLIFIAAITISDGYYAFFTLLLLGFSTFIRIATGDIKRPASLLVPLSYIATVFMIALLLAWPITNYKKNNPNEFAPNGVTDPALVKHNYEAEIYVLSPKLLFAPSTRHRIESFSNLGKDIIETSDKARHFKTQIVYTPLGILGTFLLLGGMTLMVTTGLNGFSRNIRFDITKLSEYKLIWAAIALSFFIFLSSISGGIGTLIALVYPTIRAYDRFPLFLMFVLYVGAGAIITATLKKMKGKKRLLLISLTLLITTLSIYDQLPNNIDLRSNETRDRFLSEKKIITEIEEKYSPGAMIYQYPYSQWLTNSDYYGWGSFAHVRLYLHSATLRWSNGASKNSPVDDWHLRMSRLPMDQLLAEMQAVGFKGVLVDRRVVSPLEYQRVRKALLEVANAAPLEDEASKLAFFSLHDPGYLLVYDKFYKDPVKLVISDRTKLNKNTLSQLINSQALKNLLDINNDKNSFVIERAAHPEVFFSEVELGRGFGDIPIFPLSELSKMEGTVQCTVNSSAPYSAAGKGTLVMKITNNTNFDWKLNHGKFPLQVGVHLRSLDGALLRWDDGLRVPTGAPGYVTGKVTRSEPFSIKRGNTEQLHFSLSQLNLKGFEEGHQKLIADFRMVQDGHAWFEHLGCKIVVKN